MIERVRWNHYTDRRGRTISVQGDPKEAAGDTTKNYQDRKVA